MAWILLRRKARGEFCIGCHHHIPKGSRIVSWYGIATGSEYYHPPCARLCGMTMIRYHGDWTKYAWPASGDPMPIPGSRPE